MVLVALRKGPIPVLPDLRGHILAVPVLHGRGVPGLKALADTGLEEERDFTVLHLAEEATEPDVEVLKAVLSGRAEAGLLDAASWDVVVAAHRVPKGAFDVVRRFGTDAVGGDGQ